MGTLTGMPWPWSSVIRSSSTKGTDTSTAPVSCQVQQQPCRSIFPPWPWPSVIRSNSTQGERHQDHDGADGGAVAVPLDLPAVAVAVGDPEQLHQVNDSKTTMEQTVEQSPCRRSSPENRDYSPWMQVLTVDILPAVSTEE